MAASSFQSLHSAVGSRALDEIVPSLMVALESGEKDEVSRIRALNGLTGILSVRSRELLPYVIPRLIARPITTSHAKVLAGVAQVTGSTIHYHFTSIIPALLGELSELEDEEVKSEAVRSCAQVLCVSVDEVGVNWLISEIASKCNSDKASLRASCCEMFNYVVTKRTYTFELQKIYRYPSDEEETHYSPRVCSVRASTMRFLSDEGLLILF
jgi:hypothetical protein